MKKTTKRTVAHRRPAVLKLAPAPAAAPTHEMHIHPGCAQLTDGTDTPVVVINSPRGDVVALNIVASSFAEEAGFKVRRFDKTGKEL